MWNLGETAIKDLTELAETGIAGEPRKRGEDPETRIRMLAPVWQNTYCLEHIDLFRVSRKGNVVYRLAIETLWVRINRKKMAARQPSILEQS